MTTLKFDKYQREAQVKPLEIDLPDGGVVTIAVPNGRQFMDAEEAGSTRRALRIVCGDQWSQLEPLVDAIEDPEALRDFVRDVMGAFRMAGGDTPPADGPR